MTDTTPNPDPQPAPQSEPAPQPSATPEWLKGADENALAVAKAKGWQSPLDVITGYVNLEKLVGSPNKIVLPAEDDEKGWNEVFAKLGRPEAPEKYALEKPQLPEGADYDPDVEAAFRTVAHKLGLTNRQAKGIYEWYMQGYGQAVSEKQTQAAQSEAQLQAELKGKWGADYDRRLNIARRAVQTLAGGDTLTLDALENLIGSAALVERFYDLGTKLGEDRLVGTGGDGFQHRTPAEARAEIARLQADPDFWKAYTNKDHPDHANKVKLMEQLHQEAWPETRNVA